MHVYKQMMNEHLCKTHVSSILSNVLCRYDAGTYAGKSISLDWQKAHTSVRVIHALPVCCI